MKVLIISNDFYPVNKIGALRINAFAKYFHLAGHSVTVLAEGEKTSVFNEAAARFTMLKTRL